MAMRTRQGQLRLPDLLRELLHVLVLAAALQRGDAGAAELQNVVALEHSQKGVDPEANLPWEQLDKVENLKKYMQKKAHELSFFCYVYFLNRIKKHIKVGIQKSLQYNIVIKKEELIMKITLRGKNIEITEAIEEKVSEKLSKLDKYFIVSENVEAKVLVRTYPYGQKIEVTIPTEYVLLRAEVVDQDLYNAIDLVIDKLEGQIRKYKTRLNRKSKDNKLAFNLASIEPLEDEEEDVLVKTKTITPKPMDMEEAIMQMELIGHSFFVYRDTETDAISIVYRRNDGDYGLIETEQV